MVTEAIKTGYWRINPATGGRDWIEGSYAPKRPKLKEEKRLEVEPITPEPIEEIELITPEVPTVEVTELAERYGLFPARFVKPEQLADMALPPEERAVQWLIPYEQYLTWEQAKFLGFDVPEGSVVKMTPMAGGEPTFTLVREPAEAPRLPVELEATLRATYPEMFDPARSYGYSPEEIPLMVAEQIQLRMQSDYQGFVDDLYARVGEYEAERILKELGVTEENILLSLDFEKQEERVTMTLQAVFPDYSIETFGRLLETDFELFIETMQTGGSSREKRQLLEDMGYNPDEINQIFSRQRLVLDIDGVRQQVTVDVANQVAYDERGNYVGAYNSATKQFTRAPEKNIAQNFVDWTMFQSRTLWEQGENFFLSVLPEIIYADIPENPEDRGLVEKFFGADLVKFMNETNRQQRENFRWLYGKNKQEYEGWVRKHSELLAPVDYQEGAFKNPELLKDVNYYVYELANIMPFIIAATGTAILTGGVGLPAVLATASIMAPVEGQAVYEDLINAGAPEDKAAPMAFFAGGIIGMLESAGRIPILKQVSPLIFGQFKKKAISELAKKGLFESIKKFGRAFTISQFAEITTEVAQEVVSNVAVGVYDENRSIVENLPDIAVKTAVATLLPSGFAAGVSVRMVGRQEQIGLTDLAKKAKGWLQDNKGNWFEAVKEAAREERGAIGRPAEILKKLATPAETELLTSSREQAKKIGIDLEAIQGISEGEYWVSLTTTKLTGTEEFNDWIQSLRETNFENAEKVKKLLVGKFEEKAGEKDIGFGRKRFIPFKNIQDAQKFLETGDTSLITSVVNLKGTKWTPKQLEETKQILAGMKPTVEAFPFLKKPPVTPEEPTVADFRLSEVQEEAKTAGYTIEKDGVPEAGKAQAYKLTKGEETKTFKNLEEASEFLTGEPSLSEGMREAFEAQAEGKDKAEVKKLAVKHPLPTVTELTIAEVTENRATVGQPKLTLKQAEVLAGFFGDYVLSKDVITAFELQRALWSRVRSERAEDFKARMQDLIVTQGVGVEEAFNQATKETLAGELPSVRTDFFEGTSDELRSSLFTVVYHNKGMQQYPLELAATITALTNALTGKPIPRIKGKGSVLFPEGGSAWDRLNYVFGKRPKVLKAIEKMAEEKESLKDVVEAVFHETGREPIPVDQETADYLRKLSGIPFGYKTLLEPPFNYPATKDLRNPADLQFAKVELDLGRQFAEGKLTFDEFELARRAARDKVYPLPPVTKYEFPIEEAIKQVPLVPRPVMDSIVQVLKEIGMSPVDIGGAIRAHKSSFDQSYIRQIGPLIPAHKVRFALSFVDAWKGLFNQKSVEALRERTIRDPEEPMLYAIYDQLQAKDGRDFLRPWEIAQKGTEQHKGLEEMGYLTTERLIPRWTAKLPYLKVFGRAFISGTNSMTWGVFKDFYRAQLKLSEKYASGKLKLRPGESFDIMENMDRYAVYLAERTGRAGLGRLAKFGPALGNILYAPRYALGQVMAPRHLFSANKYVRKEAWKDAVMWVGTIGGLLVLGDTLDWWDLEKDRNSADYGKIRIGNLHIDPWSGTQQFFVFFSRLYDILTAPITGRTPMLKSSVTGSYSKLELDRLVNNMVETKLAPIMSLFREYATGETFGGEPLDVKDVGQWLNRVGPMSIVDVYEAIMEESTTAPLAGTLSFFGTGVQTYTGDWVENWKKLGVSKYPENIAYGLAIPPYDTTDFWTDTSSQFKGVDSATLTKEKGFPDYIRAIAEARIINEYLSTLPRDRLVSLNADTSKGATFVDYRSLWGDRQKLVVAGDEAEWTISELQPDKTYKATTYKGEEAVDAFDKDETPLKNRNGARPKDAHMGNFSQRQFALLNEYWAIVDKKKQAEFLEKHKADIGINPRQDYLRTHSSENAQLAVWGQAKILTKEAYTEFNSLVKSLDIPDNAIPELTLPPETSIDTHFRREELVDEGREDSVEGQLLLLKDQIAAEEAEVQSYADWKDLQVSDKPVEYLQLRVDNADLYDKLEEAGELPTKAEQKAAREAVRATQVNAETFQDIERRVDAMGKGTRETPISEELVNGYRDYMRIVDATKLEGEEAELQAGVKLFRYDTPGLDAFLQDEDVWGEGKRQPLHEDKEYLDNYLVPRWRIDVEFKDEDIEYGIILAENQGIEERAATQAYLAGEGAEGEHLQRRIEYAKERRRREVLEMKNKLTDERFPLDQVENFVLFSDIPIKGKRRDRFLVENGGQDPDNLTGFAKAMHDIAGIDIPKAEEVPSVEYDNLYDEWREDFIRLDGFSDNESPHYIEDVKLREDARQTMRFTTDGKYTAFGLAEIKQDAYGKFVPEQYTEAYVGYYKIIGEGKPENWKLDTGTDLWYEDDWYMMENIEFYREVYRDLLGREKWDFTKVPTREVFNQYLTYIALPHLMAKDDFRWTNLELDAWLVVKFDYTPVTEKKRREALTPYESFIEKWAERGKAIEERLAKLRE